MLIPSYSPQKIVEFAKVAAISSLTFNFVNEPTQMPIDIDLDTHQSARLTTLLLFE